MPVLIPHVAAASLFLFIFLPNVVMCNGGRYYNEEFGGEVYYDAPSMRTFLGTNATL